MNNYLSIDVGTTCCKCQLFSSNGEILKYLSKEYEIKYIDNEPYVNVDAIKENLFSMIKEISNSFDISSICVSSIGESFVLLDEQDNILFYPMLFADTRGEEEANEIEKVVDLQRFFEKTGTIPQPYFSVTRLLYIKKHHPELYQKAHKILLMCDYIGYVLTGERMIDYSLASRTGILNIEERQFDTEICQKLGINPSLFSNVMPMGSIVGNIKESIKKTLGLKNDVVVVLGSHDQICNAIGCGCLHAGEATDGLGTAECITTIFDSKSNDVRMGQEGYVIVPYIKKGLYCTYIFNSACNSITNWFKNEIKDNKQNFFNEMEEKMDDSINDLYCLPYFAGSLIPHQDSGAKGAFIGISTSTKDYELYKSILEGLCMEMRFEVENGKKFGIFINSLICTGGGSLSKKRLQMKADIQNVNVSTLRSQEGGLCGCAIVQAVAMKAFNSYEEALPTFVKVVDSYQPRQDKHLAYEPKYQKYIKIYKNIKEFFN